MSGTIAKETAYTLLAPPALNIAKTGSYTAFLPKALMVAEQTVYVALLGATPLRRRPLFLF